MHRFLIPLTFLWAGCLAEVDVNTDPDLDGLSDADEAALGSDPGNPDSDGDTFSDGEEAAQSTDPTDPDDHPYLGGWRIDACRDDDKGEDAAADFSLMDQFGEQVTLHSFCDRVVYMVFAAFW